MDTLDILIPYRSSPQRHSAALYTARFWDEYGHVITADAPGEEWSRSAAINAAYARGSAPYVCVCDADTVPGPDLAIQAIAIAQATAQHTVIGDLLHHLTQSGTDRILAGDPLVDHADCEWHWASYSPFILSRARWIPFDAHFNGWGGEDVAHQIALKTLVGLPIRVPGDVWHLNHGWTGQGTNPHWQENEARENAYRQADGDVAAVRALVDEP